MRTTALVLGIVGGILGIIAGLLAMLIGGAAAGLGASGGVWIALIGFVAVLLGVAGIVGGVLGNNGQRAGWILLLVAGLAGFLAMALFWLPAGLLLVSGAVCAYRGLEPEPVS